MIGDTTINESISLEIFGVIGKYQQDIYLAMPEVFDVDFRRIKLYTHGY